MSRINSDALLDYLFVWKSFFRSPSQLLTNVLALCLEMYGLAYCEASYLANWLCTSYSALIPHADTLTPKQGWSSWIYIGRVGQPAWYLCLHRDTFPVQAGLGLGKALLPWNNHIFRFTVSFSSFVFFGCVLCDCPDEARRWGWRIGFASARFWLPASSTRDTRQVWAWQLINRLDFRHKMNLARTDLSRKSNAALSERQAFACCRLCLVPSAEQLPRSVGVKGAAHAWKQVVCNCLWLFWRKKTVKAQKHLCVMQKWGLRS